MLTFKLLDFHFTIVYK